VPSTAECRRKQRDVVGAHVVRPEKKKKKRKSDGSSAADSSTRKPTRRREKPAGGGGNTYERLYFSPTSPTAGELHPDTVHAVLLVLSTF